MSAAPRRPVALASWICVAATVVAGCSPSESGPETDPAQAPSSLTSGTGAEAQADVQDEIAAVLAARSQAVREGDRSAFLATVDLTNRKFAARQRTLFTNLMALPIESFGYRTTGDSLIPAGADAATGLTSSPEVVEELQLRRTDRAPVSNRMQMTFAKRGDRWVLLRERDKPTTAARSGVQSRPWGGAAIHVVRRGKLVVVVDRDLRSRADQLADLVLREIASDAEVLRVRPRYDLVVDATSSGIRTRLGGSDRRAALAVFFVVYNLSNEADSSPRLAGRRIKFNPRRVEELIGDRVIVRHELAHFLTSAVNPFGAKWVSEGLANYVAYFPLRPANLVLPAAAYDRVTTMKQALPKTDTFGANPVVDYTVSQAAATYLIDAFGIELFKGFLAGFKPAAGPVDDQARKLLRRRYGLSQADLVRETWIEINRFNRG